ncbi:hypothetical protein MMU07_17190 [Aquiflexum sp. LQ15W]|uniref:hypothetical protein n=1 Tax=Cognataquiflexum nitidum TaxID=2922272 RepID=UPI001F12FBCA|nr:hypothetical protein [Cognataquiflexum nitidum]MCH6201321.1 hypothetical protein [Cognataquiflexum nitidum]
MGVLLHKVSLAASKSFTDEDSEDIFQDAIAEIKTIINSSHLERQSKETKEGGFDIDLIKSNKDRIEDYCKFLNRIFIHKRFEADE